MRNYSLDTLEMCPRSHGRQVKKLEFPECMTEPGPQALHSSTSGYTTRINQCKLLPIMVGGFTLTPSQLETGSLTMTHSRHSKSICWMNTYGITFSRFYCFHCASKEVGFFLFFFWYVFFFPFYMFWALVTVFNFLKDNISLLWYKHNSLQMIKTIVNGMVDEIMKGGEPTIFSW